MQADSLYYTDWEKDIVLDHSESWEMFLRTCKPHLHAQPSRGGWHKTRGLQLFSMPKGLGKKVKGAIRHCKYTRNTFLFAAAMTEGITDAEKQPHSSTSFLCTNSTQSSSSCKVAADQTFLDIFQTLKPIKAIWAVCSFRLSWITPASSCPPPPFQADSSSTRKRKFLEFLHQH